MRIITVQDELGHISSKECDKEKPYKSRKCP